MKQAELATASGLSEKTIWKLENGKVEKVHVDTLWRIANVFKVHINTLYKSALFNTLPEASIYDINRIDGLGWDVPDLLKEMIDLDKDVYGGLTSDEREGTVAQWCPIFARNPDTWRVLINAEERLVGYWHFMCLSEDAYRDLRRGSLFDTMITPERVLPLLPGSYNIYFASLVLMNKYSGSRYLSMLFESILDICIELARNEIYFREICTNAFSPAGEALCNKLKFTHISDNIIHGKMYECKFPKFIDHPVISRLIGRGRAELRRLYAHQDE